MPPDPVAVSFDPNTQSQIDAATTAQATVTQKALALSQAQLAESQARQSLVNLMEARRQAEQDLEDAKNLALNSSMTALSAVVAIEVPLPPTP